MEKSNIVLSGFMASGKTTVGTILAKSTGMPLVDTDDVIEQEVGQAVTEIFANDGETRFRELERRVVAVESAREGIVLAVGGGAVLDERNVTELKKRGILYFLDVTAGEVASRVGEDSSRPLLPGDSSDIESLMRERARTYRDTADVVVPTSGRDPRDVAGEIASDFESRRRGA